MKDCCRTEGTEPRQPNKNWLKWLIYAAVVLALAFVALQQVNH
ncbi:hypothetical protein [Pontibacter anaerobius]|uniref:Uncharacterized protein n=1 Tax=Pontibacter anaerobius TaxID=2993940 RepID=A0ABT3RHX1_9BACT|nr:hypothetical protein [Pontibacter anaerobius]MCX2741207.1 hypothetical protein [Pontibacter anaerobius]